MDGKQKRGKNVTPPPKPIIGNRKMPLRSGRNLTPPPPMPKK